MKNRLYRNIPFPIEGENSYLAHRENNWLPEILTFFRLVQKMCKYIKKGKCTIRQQNCNKDICVDYQVFKKLINIKGYDKQEKDIKEVASER